LSSSVPCDTITNYRLKTSKTLSLDPKPPPAYPLDSILVMKILSAAFGLVFAAGFIQTAALYCDSDCAVAGKFGSTNGENIKTPCDSGFCADK